MKNVMVCVTQQKTCDRLIKYGSDFLENNGELFVIHVAAYQLKFLGNSKEGEALDYLFEKTRQYGAYLTVIRSDDILSTLIEEVGKHNITHVVLGETREAGGKSSLIETLEQSLASQCEIVVIPA